MKPLPNALSALPIWIRRSAAPIAVVTLTSLDVVVRMCGPDAPATIRRSGGVLVVSGVPLPVNRPRAHRERPRGGCSGADAVTKTSTSKTTHPKTLTPNPCRVTCDTRPHAQ
ncbi:hypothetical protein GCM10027160_08460 [Streptomyces calidiresistens]